MAKTLEEQLEKAEAAMPGIREYAQGCEEYANYPGGYRHRSLIGIAHARIGGTDYAGMRFHRRERAGNYLRDNENLVMVAEKREADAPVESCGGIKNALLEQYFRMRI